MRLRLAVVALWAGWLAWAGPTLAQTPTFPSEVELVTVDVVVTDDKGNVLRDLGRDDFTLSEDGQLQSLATFEAIDRRGPRDPRPFSPVTTNEVEEEQRSDAFVLLVDDMGIETTRLPRLLKALTDVLTTSFRAGDELIVATVSGSLWWGLRLPEDQDDLRAVLQGIKEGKPVESSFEFMTDYEAYQIANLELRGNRSGGWSVYTERVVRRWGGTSTCVDAAACAHQVAGRARERDRERRARTQALLAAVEKAVFSLRGIRGRKELLLFSPGFLAALGQPEGRQVAGLCREANVVVNFLDARGMLFRLPEASAAFAGAPPDPFELGTASFEQRMDEIGGSVDLAVDTGGLAVTGSDDFAGGARRILDESRYYYMLGYHPPPGKGPRDWRKLQVKVKTPGGRVRTRKGYTLRQLGASDPPVLSASTKKKNGRSASEPSRSLELDRALLGIHSVRGLPLRTLPYVLDETEAGKIRVRLAVEVDGQALAPPGEGAGASTLRLVVQSARRDGGASRDDKRYSVSKPDRARRWATLYHELALAPGRTQLRVAVRDEGSGRIGAVTLRVEVPEAGTLRLASPVLTDALQEPRKEGVPPRLIVPGHRTFGRAAPMLFCQVQVLGAAPSREVEGPEMELSYVLKAVGGEEVARSVPNPIKAAPDGSLRRLYAIPLRGLASGAYELVLRAREAGTGRSVERVEPFRLESDDGH